MSSTKRIDLDEVDIQAIIIKIETMIIVGREQLEEIEERYSEINTYHELRNGDKLLKMYSMSVDDYSKLSRMASGVSEAMMDIRTIRKTLRNSNLPPSMEKTIRSSMEYCKDQLELFKEAVVSVKESLSARNRFYNSCTYIQYDKIFGSKC